MKKLGIVLILIITIIVTYFIYSNNNNEEIKVVRIPHCIVNGSTYFTHDARYPENHIPEDYFFYGIVEHIVKGYETSTIDLTTNTPDYYEKAVYVKQGDSSTIFVQLDQNTYVKLWKSGSEVEGNAL